MKYGWGGNEIWLANEIGMKYGWGGNEIEMKYG
jgi:hypothetical protein